jgi:hypothetical protein
MAIKEIIAQLPTLSKEELQTVKSLAEHLIGNGTTLSEEDTIDSELYLFYTQISHRMEEKGISTLPWPVLIRRPIFREFKKKFGTTKTYTLRYLGNLSRLQRQRLYNIYASIIVDWIDHQPKIPLRTTTVIRAVDYVPSLMNKSFPGYVESGLLHLILDLRK